MNLLTLVLTSHLDGGGGSDWKFCLLAGSILSEIAMKNAIKGDNYITNNNNNDNNSNDNLAVDIPRGDSSFPLTVSRSNWNLECWFLRREKNPGSKDENQLQI